jgi:hypothetical protein
MRPARSAATGTLSVEAVRVIALGAAARGLPPDQLCRRFAIDPALVADVDARVPVTLVVELWETVPALIGDDDFGLHLAELASSGPLGLGGHLIASAPDLARGLERMLRLERVFHDVKSSELVVDGDEARLIHDTTGALPLPRHAAEFGTAWVVLLARRTTGAAVTPRAVHFAHEAPASVAEHSRLLGVEPRFGAPTSALHLHRADLSRPHRAADPALAEILASHARVLLGRLPDGPDISALVRRAIHDGLAAGDATLEAIAAALAITPRTLQRQLRAASCPS